MMATLGTVINQERNFKSFSWHGFGLLLISAGALCFEVNLTRLFSVSQFYHFAFMVVSIAVLGFGASGTYLALRKIKPERSELQCLPWLAGGAAISMSAAYLFVNLIPFDSFQIALNPLQILLLLLHYAALSIPFFFCGMIISLMLSHQRRFGGQVYALNLFGSALGCLAAVVLPGWVDGEGVVLLSAVFVLIGGSLFTLGQGRYQMGNHQKMLGKAIFLGCSLLIILFLLGYRLVLGSYPGFFELKLSPYKGLSYALQPPEAHVASSRWNSFSKVDIVSSLSLHALPGLSYRYSGPVPEIQGLFIDGDHLNPILPEESALSFADYLPGAVAYQRHPDAHVLILEPKGGIAIQAALALDADQVTVVEANPLIVEASPGAYQQEAVRLVSSSGRSFLQGVQAAYDIIQMPLTDSYHPVSSGAYGLHEDFRYTVEAVEDMLRALKPDGMLVITRWLQEEPTEWLRTFSIVTTALEGQGLDPNGKVVALRSYNTGTLLVKLTPFQAEEMAQIRKFASERAFDLAFGPELEEEELNRFNVLPEPIYYFTFQRLLASEDREDFYQNYPFDVRPPTDNHPFFGHYFKWSQMNDILTAFGTTWQPFGGAGYLVLLILLALALLLSLGLILLPLLTLKKSGFRLDNRGSLIYFGLIGLGFMLVEVPLIQKFILYLDQPAYAFAAVLFCVLLFSGLGSRYGSRKIPLPMALLALFVLLVLYVFILSPVISATLGYPLHLRLGLSVLLITPLGFLMGVPFPGGLAWIRRQVDGDDAVERRWIAWMWAVNGAASVVASILASLVSLSLGFTETFAIGAGIYGLSWMVAVRNWEKR